MKFDDIREFKDVSQYLNSLKSKVLIIFSKTAVKVGNIHLNKENFILYSTNEVTKEVLKIENLIKTAPYFEEIISIGGGTATDIGKYISFKTHKKLTCILTMLSTNAYATNKVALIIEGKKSTLEAKLPDLILIDKKILKLSSQFNVYGIADVLSIQTALKDWEIAIKENNESSDKMYDAAKKLLEDTKEFILNNSYEDIVNNPEKLFYLIGESGEITNKYGCGKPESASEHIFAKELESLITIPHGIAVAHGIILLSLAQDNFSEDIYNCLEKLKIFENSHKFGVNFDLIKKAFNNMKPRVDRYTIVNSLVNNDKKRIEVLEKFQRIIRG